MGRETRTPLRSMREVREAFGLPDHCWRCEYLRQSVMPRPGEWRYCPWCGNAIKRYALPLPATPESEATS